MLYNNKEFVWSLCYCSWEGAFNPWDLPSNKNALCYSWCDRGSTPEFILMKWFRWAPRWFQDGAGHSRVGVEPTFNAWMHENSLTGSRRERKLELGFMVNDLINHVCVIKRLGTKTGVSFLGWSKCTLTCWEGDISWGHESCALGIPYVFLHFGWSWSAVLYKQTIMGL